MGSLYGYEIDSELPLRRLNRAPGRRGVVQVRRTTSDLDAETGIVTAYTETESGEAVFAAAETADGCLLSFPASGAFHVAPAAGRIMVAPRGPLDEVEHRLACSALCTLLAMRGDLVIHASAVETPDGAVLFCGPSGRGKSTLAHALAQLGFPVLCEDGTVVELSAEGPIALPGPRGVRLRQLIDGVTRVSLVAEPVSPEPAPCPVNAVAVLDERGPALRVEPLQAVRALVLLTPSLAHTGGQASLARSFALLGSLLQKVPTFRVSLPDSLDALPEAAGRLLDRPLGSS